MDHNVTKSVCMNSEVLAFRVAGQDFCFDLTSVREIRGWTETTILPHSQAFVKGVINLRGAVVPVIDLSERLGFGVTQVGARHVIIITVIESQTIGLLADVVSDILTIDESNLKPVPDMVEENVRKFISGVLIRDEKIIRIMNIKNLFSIEDGVPA